MTVCVVAKFLWFRIQEFVPDSSLVSRSVVGRDYFMSSTQQQGIGLVENGGPGTPSRDTYDKKQRTLIRGSGVRVSPGRVAT